MMLTFKPCSEEFQNITYDKIRFDSLYCSTRQIHNGNIRIHLHQLSMCKPTGHLYRSEIRLNKY